MKLKKIKLSGGDEVKKLKMKKLKWFQFFKIVRSFQKDTLGYILELWKNFGDTVRIPLGFQPIHLLTDPDFVQQVLVKNNSNYSRSTMHYKTLRFLLGEGLLTSDGSFWLQQRRLMQNAFAADKIPGFADCVVEKTTAMLQNWKQFESQQKPFDVTIEMGKLALQIAAKAFLGIEMQNKTEIVMRAISELNVVMMEEMTSVLVVPAFIPIRRNRRFKAAKKILDELIFAAIENARTSQPRSPLLQALMESEVKVSTKLVRDELITILLAGHETTAKTLSWTWFLLANHLSVRQNLYAELQVVLRGKNPTLDDLPKLVYTKMILQESMRLYPPVWAISRKAIQRDSLGDYKIESGDIVWINSYALHRHPKFWKNAEQFDPERFRPGWETQQHASVYVPFGAGPHTCIGRYFGMTEALLILASAAQFYNLDLCQPQKIELEAYISLGAKNGIQMQCKAINP